MRLLTGILLLILTLHSPMAFSSKTELRVALYDFPPHVFAPNENQAPTGAAVDFVNQYINPGNATYEVKWILAPFSRFLSNLENEKADMGILLAKTPEREQRLKYAETPIFTTSAGIIVDKNFKLEEIKSLKSLEGLTLGHTQGSLVPPYLAGLNIHFDYLSGEDVVERNMQRLKAKRIDGIFVPTFSNGQYQLSRAGATDNFRILKLPHSSLDLYIVFRKNIDKEIYTNLNLLIKKHRADYGNGKNLQALGPALIKPKNVSADK